MDKGVGLSTLSRYIYHSPLMAKAGAVREKTHLAIEGLFFAHQTDYDYRKNSSDTFPYQTNPPEILFYL